VFVLSIETASDKLRPQIAEWVFATFLSFQHRFPEYTEKMKACYWDETGAGAGGADIEDAVGLRV